VAILVLLSSSQTRSAGTRELQQPRDSPCVARLVTHPTALHWTSTLGLSIWRIRGSKPPSLTIRSLLSAAKICQKMRGRPAGGWVALTIDGEVAECSTRGPLYLRVMAAEEEENRIQCVSTNGSHLLLRNFCESESCAALEVDVVGERESGESGERWAREKVGCRAIWRRVMRVCERDLRGGTYSQGTARGLRRLLFRSQAAVVRRTGTCAHGLCREWIGRAMWGEEVWRTARITATCDISHPVGSQRKRLWRQTEKRQKERPREVVDWGDSNTLWLLLNNVHWRVGKSPCGPLSALARAIPPAGRHDLSCLCFNAFHIIHALLIHSYSTFCQVSLPWLRGHRTTSRSCASFPTQLSDWLIAWPALHCECSVIFSLGPSARPWAPPFIYVERASSVSQLPHPFKCGSQTKRCKYAIYLTAVGTIFRRRRGSQLRAESLVDGSGTRWVIELYCTSSL